MDALQENHNPKRNIRLDFEYDGRNYCGWQWQKNGTSIEATVMQSLEIILKEKVKMYSCGRTDAGVNAEQHVAHVFTTASIPCSSLLRGMNSLLPDDIALYYVRDMALDWSARHDPYEREYRYSFFCGEAPSAHFHHRSYWVRKRLNVAAMAEAARCFEGEHDFSAFRSAHCGAKNPVRHLFECRLVESLPFVHFVIRGTAFLRHQIRIMAGTLLKVGLEVYPPERVKKILDSKDRTLAAHTLPPQGLTLTAVKYKEDETMQIKRPTVFG